MLPYHDYGKEKWLSLGVKYPLEDIKAPTNEEVEKARNILMLKK